MINSESSQLESFEESGLIGFNFLKPPVFTVEIFKTDVQNEIQANQLIKDLYHLFPTFKMNFDLLDCDKILRIAGEAIITDSITDFITSKGYICQLLH